MDNAPHGTSIAQHRIHFENICTEIVEILTNIVRQVPNLNEHPHYQFMNTVDRLEEAYKLIVQLLETLVNELNEHIERYGLNEVKIVRETLTYFQRTRKVYQKRVNSLYNGW